MKLTLLAIVLLVFCVLIGCSKSDMIEPGNLVTKWTLVNDSVSNSVGNSYPHTKNYAGTTGDYFDSGVMEDAILKKAIIMIH